MFTTTLPEIKLSDRPDRLVAVEYGLSARECERIARYAVDIARQRAPKMSGSSAAALEPLYLDHVYGIYFPSPILWYQDHGTRPFVMRSLAGKTIPMWVDDPAGTIRAKNPKAKTRTTASGRFQVLIFRRAGMPGQRIQKMVKDRKTGQMVPKSVPASYPGAPGRINQREAGSPMTTPGRTPGAIAPGNGGVRWRHPGISPRLFMNSSILLAAQHFGVNPQRVYVADAGSNIQAHLR